MSIAPLDLRPARHLPYQQTIGARQNAQPESRPLMTTMIEPITVLSAVTYPISVEVDLHEIRTSISLQTTTTGNPTTVTIGVDRSLDGSNWVPSGIASTSTVGDFHTATTGPIRYVRVNCTTLAGGSNPSITAIVAAN